MQIRPGTAGKYKLRDIIPHYTRMIPTPRASDWKGSGMKHSDRGRNPLTNSLMDAVESGLAPTPQARDHKSHKRTASVPAYSMLNEKVGTKTGLRLQPAFALWMMGFPPDWCDLADGEMPPSRRPATR